MSYLVKFLGNFKKYAGDRMAHDIFVLAWAMAALGAVEYLTHDSVASGVAFVFTLAMQNGPAWCADCGDKL